HENLARAQIAVDVGAERQARLSASIDVAPDYGASTVWTGVDVVDDRRNEARRRTWCRAEPRAKRSLPNAPTVIAALRDNIDFLARILSDVACVKLAG